MEWVDRMNAVMDYVESRLCDQVDPEVISRLTACPISVFQRSFVQITGFPLGEYIRRRKLTCAADEIQKGTRRILDIAMDYGYESADAFAVAFKRMHGTSPAAARRTGCPLKFYSRLHFTLTIKGVDEMDYKWIEREAFNVAGFRMKTPQAGGTWAVIKSDGSIEKMSEAAGKGFISLGLCFGFDDDGSNDYMCAYEYDGESPAGFDTYTVPKSGWMVFEASGAISEKVLGGTWGRIYGEFMPQSTYKQRDLPTIERYLEWDEAKDRCRVEILIPVTG